MKTKRSIYNFIFNLINIAVTFAVGIIIPRLFIVRLGSEANGLVASVGQIFSYVSLMEAGIGATAIQALYKPIVSNDRLEVNRILAASNKYYKKIGAVYVACVVAIALVYPLIVNTSVPKWQVVGIVLFSGMGNAINFLLQQNYIVLLSAEGKGYITTNMNLIVNVLASLAKAALLMYGYPVVTVIGSQFAFTLVRILLLRIYIQQNYDWIDMNAPPDHGALSQRKYVMAQQISYFVYSNTDILVLTVFCNLTVVSVYTVYMMIVGVIEGITSTLTTSTAFALGQLYQENFDKFKKVYSIYDSLYMTMVFALFAVVYLCIVPFLSVYTRGVTDANYLDYKLAFLFVALKMVTTLRSQSQNTVNFAGHFKETQHMAIIEAVSNVLISLAAVNFIGIYGVVIGSIVSTFYRGIATTNYVNKKILHNTGWESVVKYFRWSVYLGTFLLLCVISKSVIPETVNGYFEWIKLAIPCSVVVCCVYSVLWFVLDKKLVGESVELVKGMIRR